VKVAVGVVVIAAAYYIFTRMREGLFFVRNH
jgi:hypothetical protein